MQPGARVRRRLRQLGRGRHRRRAGGRRHQRRVPRQGGARHDPHVVDRAGSHTAIFTHGHIDHVFGVDLYEEEARTNGWAAPRVIAHEAIAARFDRYRMTAGYNAVINQRQFGARTARGRPSTAIPTRPTPTRCAIEVGGETFELFHDRGETDDATWVWSPARRVLFAGDMFIWASPNCGNPQKVQRYARDWAVAFRKMAALEPEVLLPGPRAADRRRRRVCSSALTEGAELLESLVEQTLALMNEGARLDDIVHTRARAGTSARTSVPARRSTTSPSSSCATSGASTAAGTTATRRTSSPRRPACSPREIADARRRRGAARGAGAGGRGGRRPAARRPPRRAGRAGRARRRGRARGARRGVRRPGRARRRRRCRRASSRGPSTNRARSRRAEHEGRTMKIEGSKILVTGASSGIGAALAPILAERGRDGRHRRPARRPARRGARASAGRTRPSRSMWAADLGDLDRGRSRSRSRRGTRSAGSTCSCNNAAIPKRTPCHRAHARRRARTSMDVDFHSPVRMALAVLPADARARVGDRSCSCRAWAAASRSRTKPRTTRRSTRCAASRRRCCLDLAGTPRRGEARAARARSTPRSGTSPTTCPRSSTSTRFRPPTARPASPTRSRTTGSSTTSRPMYPGRHRRQGHRGRQDPELRSVPARHGRVRAGRCGRRQAR